MNNMLHVQCQGTGPDLVLLHGWANDSAVWQAPIANSWSKHFKVWSIDLPGHGKSPVVKGNYHDWLDALEHTFYKINVSNALLMGWSLGGLLALALCERLKQNTLKAFVGVCMSPCFVKKKDWDFGIELSVLNSFYSNLKKNKRKTISDFFRLQCFGSTQAQAVHSHRAHIENPNYSCDDDMLKIGLDALANLDCRTHTKSPLPKLFMLGGKDRLVSPDLSKFLTQSAVQVNLVKQWGHVPFLTDLDGFDQIFFSFLDTLS